MVNILIVDDDKNIRKLLQVVLERQGFNVHLASDGLEALRVIDQVKIDLAIVDIMMPNIDGYEFTKTLRDGNADLSVLMISAKDMVEDRKKGFMVGIDDYMTKPIDIEEFLLHVKALLRRAKINDEKKIIIGDVVVDSDSLTVTKNGETQVLPQKEFLLLF